MNENFRWGIIGTGSIAKAFARDLAFTSGHVVTAVGSRDLSKAETFAAQFNCTPLGSYEELVKQDLDAVYVATPHPMHAPNTILALEGGKPVLCEKPFAVNARESAAMIAAAKKNNLLLVEAMWSRFLPHYRLIRSLVTEGKFGQTINVFAEFNEFLPSSRFSRLHEPELAGGALLDLGIYPISFAQMILGKPNRILAHCDFTESGVDSQTSMIFAYESGAHALLSSSLRVKSPCSAAIIGTEASLLIDGDFFTPTSMRFKTISGETIDFPRNYEGVGLREQAIEFANLIAEGKKESPLMSHADTQSIMETMDEIRFQIGLRYPFED
jgi:predicted dehydrogenase